MRVASWLRELSTAQSISKKRTSFTSCSHTNRYVCILWHTPFPQISLVLFIKSLTGNRCSIYDLLNQTLLKLVDLFERFFFFFTFNIFYLKIFTKFYSINVKLDSAFRHPFQSLIFFCRYQL